MVPDVLLDVVVALGAVLVTVRFEWVWVDVPKLVLVANVCAPLIKTLLRSFPAPEICVHPSGRFILSNIAIRPVGATPAESFFAKTTSANGGVLEAARVAAIPIVWVCEAPPIAAFVPPASFFVGIFPAVPEVEVAILCVCSADPLVVVASSPRKYLPSMAE